MKHIDELAKKLSSQSYTLVTAESCTGGLIAKLCTDKAGSSGWFDCGYITYSNHSKSNMLGVELALIEKNGAVSQAVAEAMAIGALKNSQASISVSVTGIAGPDGGSTEKPVGTVWIAWAMQHSLQSQKYVFKGSREAVREQTAVQAIIGLNTFLKTK